MTGERRPRTTVGDLGVAAAMLLFGLAGTAPAGRNQPEALFPGPAAYVLVALAAMSLVAWRRFPVHVFVFTGAVLAVYLAVGYPFGPILFSAALATAGLAARRPLRLVAMLGLLDVVVVGGAIVVRALELGPVGWFNVLTHLLTAAVWVALPGAVGAAVRIRRESTARVREEQARRAVSEERLRMAQEVHDVVGHGLAVIAMQAGAGLHVLDRDPGKAREALLAIQATSRESLDGLRAELASLRGDTTGTGGEGVPRGPGVGLADLRMLVDRVRSGGLEVRLELEEPAEPVGDAVDLAAYRIVQEALTNVLRHAGPGATARVRVRVSRERLLVEVSDTGSGPAAGTLVEGSGITGMRQRAESLGGSVDVVPGPGRGVQVTAWLPLRLSPRVEPA
ncbi:MAG: sensor histidine kinase [Actinomycetota bacterium]|nr:sensor histidine kinase [Actinomycetota bacterium]